MSPSAALQRLRERLSTVGDAAAAERGDAIDIELLAELPVTPPEEKDLLLEQLWNRLHRRRAEHVDRSGVRDPR